MGQMDALEAKAQPDARVSCCFEPLARARIGSSPGYDLWLGLLAEAQSLSQRNGLIQERTVFQADIGGIARVVDSRE